VLEFVEFGAVAGTHPFAGARVAVAKSIELETRGHAALSAGQQQLKEKSAQDGDQAHD